MISIETINEPININKEESFTNLSMGIYDIYIIGGWYVDLVNFNFTLINVNNNKIIEPKKRTFKGSSYYKIQRAKLVYSVVINKGGKFRLDFNNQSSLIVKEREYLLSYFFGSKNNTLLTYLFGKKKGYKKVEIIFERQ